MASTTKFDFIPITIAGWNSEFTDNLELLEASLTARRTGVLSEAVEPYDSAAMDTATGLWKRAFSFNGVHVTAPCFGVFLSGGNAGDTVVIQTEGEVSNPEWSLKPGWPVMMGYTPGSVRCAALSHNNQVIGYAVDATTIYLESNLKFYDLATTTTRSTTTSSSTTTSTTTYVGNWLTLWSYRKSVTIVRESGAATDYQMKVLVGESSGSVGANVHCEGKCQPSFNDIRFTTADGHTLQSYWIESITGTTPNQVATIWVKINSVSASPTTFYMYYGNATVPAGSSGSDTFPFFDNFERGADGDAIGGVWTADALHKISTDHAYGGIGTRSAKLEGNGATPSMYASYIASGAYYEIRWRVWKENAAATNFYHGNGTYRVNIGMLATEDVQSNGVSKGTMTADAWQVLAARNFDWTNGDYDLLLDDTVIASGTAMESNAGQTSQIYFDPASSVVGDNTYIDNVMVRKWYPAEPTWGYWSGEEMEVAGWLDYDWRYRKRLLYSRKDGALSGIQVKILVGESVGSTGYDVHCAGHCDSAFNDLRFTNNSGKTLLPYWIESVSGTTPNQTATVWVKLDNVAQGSSIFYLYYGYAAAPAGSDGPDTFELFDDFEWGTENDPASNSGGSVTWVTGTVGPVITLAQHYSGTRSMKVPYNSTSFKTAVAANGRESIRLKYYKTNATSNWMYIYHGNGTKAMVIEFNAAEAIYYYSTTDVDTGFSLTPDAWNTLEFNNFNWTSGTYDIWLNGTKIKSGIAMMTSTAANGYVSFVGPDLNTGSVYVDDFYTRKWYSVVPALGTVGYEEENVLTTTTTSA